MDNFDLLQTTACWVCMHFADTSVRKVHTTLNPDILAEYGVTPRKNYFYDLEANVFVPFREDACEVTISADRPEYEQEVLQFANRFI